MMIRLFSIVLALLPILQVQAQQNVIPTPRVKIERTGQLFFEDGSISIKWGALSPEEFFFFEKEFQLLELDLVESKTPTIQLNWNENLEEETYVLDIDEAIVIESQTKTGHFYGLMSLLQLIGERKHAIYVQKVRLEDAPAFEWRGLHLDVSRHFFTVNEVKRFLDLMALYKFNTFHWHLTDDQGWRIEIKKYPKLTAVGGFRDSTVIGHYSDSPRKYDHNEYGGFYTQEEIKEVVKYAATLKIDVVPEIEMPGHSRAALAAYPELSCTAATQNVPGLWGVFEDIYCSKEESILFLQDVLDEVLELFPSEYIHIGGDEAPKSQWNKCSDCQKVMDAHKLENAHELQSYFIGRMDDYLTAKNRKLIGWDEILEGGLSPNAAVMSWRGEEGGIEAAKQGHYVVMSPTTYCYFDYYQSSHDSEPLAIGGYLPLEKVYKYSPIPVGLTQDESAFILGGQANVWTEYIPDFKQVEYMVYPRALALIQSLWCENKPNYQTFLETYTDDQEPFLKRHDVNFAPSIHFPELHIERAEEGVSLFWTTLNENETYRIEEYVEGFSDIRNETVLKNGERMFVPRGTSSVPTHFEFQSQTLDQTLQYQIDRSAILGANVELITTPHKKFNHNGSLNLVDGILGTGTRMKGDQWLGFREEKVEFIVELEAEKELKQLSLGFLNNNGSWIYTPNSISVYVSTNKKEWKEVNPLTLEQSEDYILRPTIELNTKGKYVKVIVYPMDAIPEGNGGAGSTPWTFIDEIQIQTL